MKNLETGPTASAPVIVDRLGPRETAAAADILSHSFVHEPLFAYLFRGHDQEAVVRALRPWFRGWIRSFSHGGEIHTARRDGELAGVGIRTAPGVYPPTGLRKLTFTLRLIRGVLRMGLTSRRALVLPKVAEEIERREPSVPFWHLAWVGVAPAQQRSGVGGALADEALRVIDDQPAPAWLVTFGAHTRALYEKRGFAVESEFRPLPDAPLGWTLRRQP